MQKSAGGYRLATILFVNIRAVTNVKMDSDAARVTREQSAAGSNLQNLTRELMNTWAR